VDGQPVDYGTTFFGYNDLDLPVAVQQPAVRTR
jgi:hypothetical protein